MLKASAGTTSSNVQKRHVLIFGNYLNSLLILLAIYKVPYHFSYLQRKVVAGFPKQENNNPFSFSRNEN